MSPILKCMTLSASIEWYFIGVAIVSIRYDNQSCQVNYGDSYNRALLPATLFRLNESEIFMLITAA